MDFQPQLIDQLSLRLQEPLPGLDAHLHMAPPMFRAFARELKVPDNARLSAVMLLLYVHEGKLYIPFIRRAEDGRVHGGQISFPGGRVEPEDVDFTHTALRETHEEVGVDPSHVNVIGNLSQIYIVPSNFIVHPRVAFMEQRPDFIANEEEVAEILEVELSTLLRQETRQVIEKTFANGQKLETPAYYVQEDIVIWGGTSMMLAEFLHVFENIY